MIIFEKELNTRHVKNIIVQEQKNKIKTVLFNTHKRMVNYHRASDDIYLFGERDEREILKIPELKNINLNQDYMVYYSQDKDQIEILYIPFGMFEY